MQKVPVLLFVLVVALMFACAPKAQTVTLTNSVSVINSGFSSTLTATVHGSSASSFTYAWTLPAGISPTSGSCDTTTTAASATCVVVGSAGTQTTFNPSVSVSSGGATIGSASTSVTVNPYHCILGTASDLGSCVAESMPVAGVGILLSLSFVAITFMLGEVFKIEGFSNWYKTELWEVTKSMLIIACIYGVLVMASSISTAFASSVITSTGGTFVNPGPCASSSALTANLCLLYQNVYSGYLTTQLNQAYAAFSAIFGLSVGVGAFSSTVVSSWFGIDLIPGVKMFLAFKFGSFNDKIFASNFLIPLGGSGYSLLKDITTIVVLPMILLLQFQYDLLPTIIVLGLAVFVPMGVLFRAIPFLRPIGGTLIGIGITIALVYPLLLLVLNLPVTNYFHFIFASQLSASTATCAGAFGSSVLVSDIACTVISDIRGAVSIVPFLLMETVVGVQNANFAAYSQGVTLGLSIVNMNTIIPVMNFITSYTADLMFQFILFFLDLIISMVVANAIARPLGGSVKFGIGKFKLV